MTPTPDLLWPGCFAKVGPACPHSPPYGPTCPGCQVLAPQEEHTQEPPRCDLTCGGSGPRRPVGLGLPSRGVRKGALGSWPQPSPSPLEPSCGPLGAPGDPACPLSPAHLAALGEDHRLGLAHSRQLINATRAHGTSPFSVAAETRRSEAHGIISATSQARTKAPCAQPQLVRAGRATRCKRKTLRPALGVSSPTRLP